MSLKNRIDRLEERHNLRESILYGVLRFMPEPILIDGIEYQYVEDVPADLRRKHSPLICGHVTAANGRVANVLASNSNETIIL